MAEMDQIASAHAAIGAEKNTAHANADTGSFLAGAISTTRAVIGSGALGKAPLKAGDDAWQQFHGGGPNET